MNTLFIIIIVAIILGAIFVSTGTIYSLPKSTSASRMQFSASNPIGSIGGNRRFKIK